MDSVTPLHTFVLHIPRDFLDRLIQTVSPRAVCVYLILEGYRAKDGTCFPGIETIAEKCGCGVTVAKDAIRELANVGAITRKRRKNTSNAYHLDRTLIGRDSGYPVGRDSGHEDIPVLTDTSLPSPYSNGQGVVSSEHGRDVTNTIKQDPCQLRGTEHTTPLYDFRENEDYGDPSQIIGFLANHLTTYARAGVNLAYPVAVDLPPESRRTGYPPRGPVKSDAPAFLTSDLGAPR